MTRFVPTSVNAVEDLNLYLWQLADPTADGRTNGMFGYLSDLHGAVWLEVDTEYEITVHQDAVLNGIAGILQPFIDKGQLPADTNTQLALLIESKRGQHLVVYDAFPQLFKDMSKTHEQMIDAGLLAEPQTL
jgi:hypothetical protein